MEPQEIAAPIYRFPEESRISCEWRRSQTMRRSGAERCPDGPRRSRLRCTAQSRSWRPGGQPNSGRGCRSRGLSNRLSEGEVTEPPDLVAGIHGLVSSLDKSAIHGVGVREGPIAVVDDVGVAEMEIGSETHRHDVNVGIRLARVPDIFRDCDRERRDGWVSDRNCRAWFLVCLGGVGCACALPGTMARSPSGVYSATLRSASLVDPDDLRALREIPRQGLAETAGA